MVSTIQVKEDVLAKLNAIKREKKLKTYDDAIRYLLKEAKVLERTHFGTLPELESFEREDIDRID